MLQGSNNHIRRIIYFCVKWTLESYDVDILIEYNQLYSWPKENLCEGLKEGWKKRYLLGWECFVIKGFVCIYSKLRKLKHNPCTKGVDGMVLGPQMRNESVKIIG